MSTDKGGRGDCETDGCLYRRHVCFLLLSLSRFSARSGVAVLYQNRSNQCLEGNSVNSHCSTKVRDGHRQKKVLSTL